jgi:hypothetical protein
MFRCTHQLLLAGVVGLAAVTSSAQAQVVRTLTTTANVPDIGVVVAVSPLQWSGQENADESRASGTVSTKHNGPYLLQARLTSVQPDSVMARVPDGSFKVLGAAEWTTVASGPGGAHINNTVEYRVGRASGPTTPSVTYRVVAR